MLISYSKGGDLSNMEFFRRFFAKKCAVGGLDLGTSSLKLVQLNAKKDKTYELVSLVIGYPPDQTLKDGVIIDSRALGDYIKQLILGNKLNMKEIVGVASGQSVILRPIRMAKLDAKDLNSSLRFHAKNYLPYSDEDAMIKGFILNDELEDDPTQMDVLLFAAPNEIIKNTQDVIRFSGLNPKAVEMEPSVLGLVLQLSVEPEIYGKTIALIHMGASFTSINIYKGGLLKQSRIVKVAGNRFTEVIAQNFNINFDEAEKMKKEKSVIRVEKDATPVAPTTMRIFNIITPVLDAASAFSRASRSARMASRRASWASICSSSILAKSSSGSPTRCPAGIICGLPSSSQSSTMPEEGAWAPCGRVWRALPSPSR